MIKKSLLMLLLIPSICYAGTVSRHTTYAVNSQVTSTNLNGNFDNILIEVNSGLDNNNADTAGGYRFLETLGSLPSAGTQGRVAFLTTDNTLNFDTGSAWTRVITASGTPSQGDIIYYDGSAWSRLAVGTSGHFLKTQGASANPTWALIDQYADTRYFGGSFTRDTSLASGTQAVTGVGFQPKAVIFFAAQATSTEASWGFAVGAVLKCISDDKSTAGFYGVSDDMIIAEETDGGNVYRGTGITYDAGGFTVTWTKTGTPTGTLEIQYIAFR